MLRAPRSIAVAGDVRSDLALGAHRRGEDETELVLLEQVGGAVARSRFGAAIGE
jgi:hypothetical protein